MATTLSTFVVTSNSSTDTAASVISETSNIIISVVIGIFLVVGSIGNVLTVATISSTTQLQTISNYFICSLCISDLFSAIVCSPLWLYRRTWGFNQWSWGEVLCKFYWVTDFTTNYVTALHIASFAAFRFTAVRKPFKIWDIPNMKIVIYILGMWVTSLLVALPLIVFMGIRKGEEEQNTSEEIGVFWPSCSIMESCVDQYHLYTLIVYPTIFLLPLMLIIVFSVLLIKRLVRQRRWFSRVTDSKNDDLATVSSQVVGAVGRISGSTTTVLDGTDNTKNKKHKKQQAVVQPVSSGGHQSPCINANLKVAKVANDKRVKKRHRKTFLQLGLVVVSFMIGYIPTSAYLMWTSVSKSKNITSDYWFGVASYLLLRFSECLNPLMYNLGSNKLRKGTGKFLNKVYKRMSKE